MHEEKTAKHANEDAVPDGAVPAYLLDREGVSRAKVLSNTVKQKRKEKAGKWNVPIPKVRPMAEAEMFKVVKTGKRKGTRAAVDLNIHYLLIAIPLLANILAKSWKRMITKVTFVGEGFTRKPPKVWFTAIGSLDATDGVGLITLSVLIVREVYSAHKFAVQESTRYSPRAENHLLPRHLGSQEEPTIPAVYATRSDHQGCNPGGKCLT